MSTVTNCQKRPLQLVNGRIFRNKGINKHINKGIKEFNNSKNEVDEGRKEINYTIQRNRQSKIINKRVINNQMLKQNLKNISTDSLKHKFGQLKV